LPLEEISGMYDKPRFLRVPEAAKKNVVGIPDMVLAAGGWLGVWNPKEPLG